MNDFRKIPPSNQTPKKSGSWKVIPVSVPLDGYVSGGNEFRDDVAVKVLLKNLEDTRVDLTPTEAARVAYAYADAMLAEREAKQ